MNELKPRVQLHAPASLKRNVLAQIDKETLHRKRIISWQWFAAAAIVAIGIMTFALWPHSRVKQYVEVKDTPAHTMPPEVSMPVTDDAPKTAEVAVHDMKKNKAYPKRKGCKRPSPHTYTPETIEHVDEKAIEKGENEIIVVGFGKALPVTGAIQQDMEYAVSDPINTQKYTPEEQRLIDQVNKHRDIVYARLADELEQASLKQRRLRQLTYDNWLQMRQILLQIYPKEEVEKMNKPLQVI